ncbi:Rho termination factor N-terminal domain-containing protein [Paenibacillus sp.]
MPKYITKAYLTHEGNVVKPEQEIELNEQQADRLGDKVELVEGEETIEDKSVTALKKEAKARSIEGYTKMEKDELIAAIKEFDDQQAEEESDQE